MNYFNQGLIFDWDDDLADRAFEAGFIWRAIKAHRDILLQFEVHASNIEMVLRMSEASGRPVISEDLGEGFLLVTFDAQKEGYMEFPPTDEDDDGLEERNKI